MKYCCLFWFVLILGIKIHQGWDRSFKSNKEYFNIEIPLMFEREVILFLNLFFSDCLA